MKIKNNRLNLIFYFVLCFFILFGILKTRLHNMDELWTFLFAKNISNGLYPYKDFNVIVTPLSMILNGFFICLKPDLITFRVLYFIYYLILICVLDRLMKLLNVKDILKFIMLFITTSMLLRECYLDYNFLQLLFVLLLIYLFLKNKDYQNKRFNVLIPFIAGLTVINKQSTGVIICFITIILIYFENGKKIKYLFNQLMIMLIPSILFMLYLVISGTFYDFYDLCVLGLFTFTNKLVLPNLIAIIIFIYVIMAILLHQYKNRELLILFLYAIAGLFVIVPIVDYPHSTLAFIIPLIFFTYVLNLKFKKITNEKVYSVILIIFIFVFAISNTYSYMVSTKIKSGVYKGVPAGNQTIQNIENVSQYILNESKEHNVYILDVTASMYKLNINQYNKYFDLFMNGNFGINGEKEMYYMLDQKNQIILIDNGFENWQRPRKMVDYVFEHYSKCGSIEQFDIYCN